MGGLTRRLVCQVAEALTPHGHRTERERRTADDDPFAGAPTHRSADLLTLHPATRSKPCCLDAGDATTPEEPARLSQLVRKHFGADLATRALALAERYVDYRVALGTLKAPRPDDPRRCATA